MSDINRVVISGNIVRDPELRTVGEKGTPLCKFTVALNETRKGGQKLTHYVDCTAWGSTANTIAEHFTKGRQIFVEGKLNLERWEAQDGSKRSKLSVTVDTFAFPQRITTDAGGAHQSGNRQRNEVFDPDAPADDPHPYEDEKLPF